MDENQQATNEQNNAGAPRESSLPKEVKHVKASGGNSKKTRKPLSERLKEVRGEFNKVIWPAKKDLAKQTVTVIVTSLIVGLVIVLYDGAFAFGVQMFSSFAEKL